MTINYSETSETALGSKIYDRIQIQAIHLRPVRRFGISQAVSSVVTKALFEKNPAVQVVRS